MPAYINRKTIYDKVKERLERRKPVMISDFKNAGTLRGVIYRLRKEGFEIKRIGERGNITGYKLIGESL